MGKKSYWNQKWKPEMAVINKKETARIGTDRGMSKSFWDGKQVYATNGEIMALYPTSKKVGIKLVKKKTPDCASVIPDRKGRVRFAFDEKLLIRLVGALGSDEKKTGVIFEIDPKNLKSAIRVEIRKDVGEENKAYGLLMPMQHIGEEIQHKV